jgi:hypothetical protein
LRVIQTVEIDANSPVQIKDQFDQVSWDLVSGLLAKYSTVHETEDDQLILKVRIHRKRWLINIKQVFTQRISQYLTVLVELNSARENFLLFMESFGSLPERAQLQVIPLLAKGNRP